MEISKQIPVYLLWKGYLLSQIGLIILGVITLLALVPGIFLCLGKGAWMIAGYNTMSKEEKSYWNAEALAHSTGKVLIVAALGTVLLGVAVWFGYELLAVIVLVSLALAGTIVWVKYINKNPKFKNLPLSEDTSSDKP